MVEFGAPTLMGLKPASLFRYRAEIPTQADRNILQLGRELAPFGLTLRVLHVCSRTDARVLYVYRAVWLRQILAEPAIGAFLEQRGYSPPHSCGALLEQLCRRLRREDAFPHEIGVFLGYPLEDVVGFIENHGRNYTCCGCWKAYGDPVAATARFDAYHRCTALCKSRYQNGADLSQLISARSICEGC